MSQNGWGESSDYRAGRSGGAPDLNSGIAGSGDYLRGQFDKKMADFDKQSPILSGPSDPNAMQGTILLIVFAVVALGLYQGDFLNAWQGVVGWLVASFGGLWLLVKLPPKVSGGIMAVVLGGIAGFIGWNSGGATWAGGSALVVGAIAYFLYSHLRR
jgi:hypothetical protein